MPSTFVYFEAFPLLIASIAACLMLSGVSKSGSPAPRPITLRPARLSATALSLAAVGGARLICDGDGRLRLDALELLREKGHEDSESGAKMPCRSVVMAHCGDGKSQ